VDANGCECATPVCCSNACAPTHKNCVGSACSGETIGQSYWVTSSPCQAVGTPGKNATYTKAMAQAAGNAAPQPVSGALCALSPTGNCTGFATCGGNGSASNVYFVDDSDSSGYCIVWQYASDSSGGQAGYVHADTGGCNCPTSVDPTWD
jgi:hypothetical protein